MSSSVVLKALGLNTSPNALDLPNGSMSKASNVVIRRDNVVESRRGFKLYGDSFGDSLSRSKQLFAYKGRILRQYASALQFDNDGEGSFSTFNGTYDSAQTGLRTKSIESNGNFYFTSAEGIKLISAKSADELATTSGYITNAGVPKAIDFKLETIEAEAGSSGFLPQDSTVAYRTVWAIKDANSNTKLGSPSQPVAIYSSTLSLLISDFMDLLQALDNVYISPITGFFGAYGDYVNTFKVASDASADTLRTKMIALAAQIDDDIRYANDSGSGVPLNISAAASTSNDVVTITTSTDVTQYLAAGDIILLAGFGAGSSSSTILNGYRTITSVTSSTIVFPLTGAVSAETFAFTSGTVRSGKYGSYDEPAVPSTPATSAELEELQVYLESIIAGLQEEPTTVIGTSNQTNYISPLDITSDVNVRLTAQVPQDVTSNHFLQVYRSTTVTGSGTDVLNLLVANSEEMQLVYEAYPTAAELLAKQMIIDDITPDIFKGANLYTNQSTGEGILQSNDVPPFALDINKFKNYVFYANTKTRHRIIPFSLIGVSNMVEDANNGITPTITIADEAGNNNTYTFVLGVQEATTILCVQKSSITEGSYFDINSALDANQYRFYMYKAVDTPPAAAGRTLVKIDISNAAVSTAAQVAARVRDVVAGYVNDFTTTLNTATVTVTNVSPGNTTNASAGTSGFTVTTTVAGSGESAANKQILLSQNVSPAIAVDETARSMIRVINGNASESIYGFYTSSLGQVPGKMVLESRDLNDDPFYIIANNDNTGSSFVPNISPEVQLSGNRTFTVSSANATVGATYTNNGYTFTVVTTIAAGLSLIMSGQGTPTASGTLTKTSGTGDATITFSASTGINTVASSTVITSASHGLVNNDEIIITNSNSTPSINGIYTITRIDNNTFSIPVTVTVAGTRLSYTSLDSAEVSQNEEKQNRIYYSKLQQPEAVPIVNFLDVGAEDKAILRIMPLRDSLFIFKEDGLFRISGETAPFYLSLFDSSCILVAPDSVSISNNLVYAYTRQGISTVSEAGVVTISRPIDTDILRVSSSDYTDFGTSTWGVGYESDNSYIVFTVQETADTHATIGYRYSNLTNTWTTFDKDSVCGIVNPADDKLYLGAGDTNYIEQERKSFSRLDYADREIESLIANNGYVGSDIQLATVSGIEIGDVVVQEQRLTPYKFNMLLKKLDTDHTVAVVDITAISGASTTLTITATNHNLASDNSDYVTIEHNTSIPSINGTYQATYISGNQFSITIDIPLTTAVADGTARLNYHDSLEVGAGDNLRTALEELAAKLDTDPNVVGVTYSEKIQSLSASMSNITVGTPPTITSTLHGLETGRYVAITGSNSTPSINGSWVVTKTGANTFTIDTTVNTAGTTGTFTTSDQDFYDIVGCFNIIVNTLNLDNGVSFTNYRPVDNTVNVETVITAVNTSTKKITLESPLDFVVGPIVIYKAIESTVTYSPNTMGDPLGLKHLREVSIMFLNRAFYGATVSFATDLLPRFMPVTFRMNGNGIFGSRNFGADYFGGASNSAPFRTTLPRNVQRCRYILIRYTHKTAREQYAIYGVTITGEIGQSTRAYR